MEVFSVARYPRTNTSLIPSSTPFYHSSILVANFSNGFAVLSMPSVLLARSPSLPCAVYTAEASVKQTTALKCHQYHASVQGYHLPAARAVQLRTGGNIGVWHWSPPGKHTPVSLQVHIAVLTQTIGIELLDTFKQSSMIHMSTFAPFLPSSAARPHALSLTAYTFTTEEEERFQRLV